MNKKAIGIVYASLAMISVGIMVVVGMVSGSWENLWLFPFCAMIIATVYAMIANYQAEKHQDKKNNSKEK